MSVLYYAYPMCTVLVLVPSGYSDAALWLLCAAPWAFVVRVILTTMRAALYRS